MQKKDAEMTELRRGTIFKVQLFGRVCLSHAPQQITRRGKCSRGCLFNLLTFKFLTFVRYL
jgi:hypothetical protein